MQRELHERMQFARELLEGAQVPMTTNDATPIFMIQFDSAPAAAATVRTLRERGFYVCVSTFPAVPLNKPSIRFTLSRHNSFEDIEALILELVEAMPRRISGIPPVAAPLAV